MRIAKTIGNVTLGRAHASLEGAQLKLVVPISYEDLERNREPFAEETVAFDELSVGIGEWIALSEGAEAAMPFYPTSMPIDAYVAAILDTVEIQVKNEK